MTPLSQVTIAIAQITLLLGKALCMGVVTSPAALDEHLLEFVPCHDATPLK